MKTTDLNSIRENSWKRISLDPFVDWIFMLLVGLAVVGILIVIGVSSYVSVGQATSSVPDQGVITPHLPINATTLGNVVKQFNPKTSDSSNTIPGDPSL